ncbi:hypothetical protein DYB35_002803 [Aphanomyces astaci]|uniref:Rho-GAP domain-containing protein n=1 Tax=Aphanomyces astaci TaxID=112090 RepID=A0A3R6XGJ6_APHAT|nr:hypothetical protein DYB35_002803 [Aphanomyces astaci]
MPRSEVTVYSFKAALYSLDESSHEWLLSDTNDDPVAQYYVFMDNADVPKFRMVGWVEDSGDVVLNNALTMHCIWLPVNEYFVQFTTPDDITVGLSFADLEQAQEASTIVLRILQNLVNVATSESNNAPREYSEGGEVDALSKTTSELKEVIHMIQLVHTVLTFTYSATSDHTSVISRPYEAKQEMHVTFNAVLARYEGLPLAWVGLNKQFGLPMEAMPKRVVDGYDSKIPAVLQMMKEYLVLHGGLETEGIFRLAPDKEQCSRVKDAINNGSFGGCNDVHIVANLIKVWFRDLPTSLFNVIPDKIMYKTCTLKTPESVMDMLADVPEASKIVILWLLDLMAEVVKHEKATKMSSKNMAIVLSPNLFSIESDNPMVALTMSQKVAEFTTVLLNARLALHHGYVK